MTRGDTRKVVPFVIEPFSEAASKKKITTSNGGKWKWDENFSRSPHPTMEGYLVRGDSVRISVG
jgi:hypothetical protein